MASILRAGLLTLAVSLSASTVWAQTSADEVLKRRDSVSAVMGDNAIALVLSAPPRVRSNDVNWPFRQSNSLYYLTHATEIDTHLMMVKNGGERSDYLFAKLSDPVHEVWEGRLPSPEELTTLSGIESIIEAKRLETTLKNLLNGGHVEPGKKYWEVPGFAAFARALSAGEAEVWLELGRTRDLAPGEQTTRAQRLALDLQQAFPELRIRNLTPVIEQARYYKSPYELERLQRAIDITGTAIEAAMVRSPAADAEYQIDATINFTFRDEGACCWAFPGIVASGANATILHYGANDAAMDREAMLLLDVGAEVEYYSADVSRTFPVDGSFSEDQAQFYNAVLVAQRETMAAVKAGMTMKQLTNIAVEALGKGLLEMGLITEVSETQVRSYFLHGLSHTLGLDTHDTFRYHLELAPGMVITIEPGLYVRPQDVRQKPWFTSLDDDARAGVEAALTRFDGMGVRIEDDVLVTQRGYENLSGAIPVAIEDIEAIMAGQE